MAFREGQGTGHSGIHLEHLDIPLAGGSHYFTR